MTELSQNKLAWVAGILFVVALFVVAPKILVHLTIREIQAKYSPSPYGPGFDPDKVDVIKLDAEKNNINN